jgi:hypothetical protein
MHDLHTVRPSRWRAVVDFISAFWPILLMPVVMFLALHFRQPWFGMIAFVIIGCMARFWWSCVFGLLNAMAVFGGFLGCAIATIKILTR